MQTVFSHEKAVGSIWLDIPGAYNGVDLNMLESKNN